MNARFRTTNRFSSRDFFFGSIFGAAFVFAFPFFFAVVGTAAQLSTAHAVLHRATKTVDTLHTPTTTTLASTIPHGTTRIETRWVGNTTCETTAPLHTLVERDTTSLDTHVAMLRTELGRIVRKSLAEVPAATLNTSHVG